MDGRPLTMQEAWEVYDGLLEGGIALYPEPPGLEQHRERSGSGVASPKQWVDAYLVAFASAHKGRVVTFDAHSSGGEPTAFEKIDPTRTCCSRP